VNQSFCANWKLLANSRTTWQTFVHNRLGTPVKSDVAEIKLVLDHRVYTQRPI